MNIFEVTDLWHRLLMDCKPVVGAEADYAEYETNRQLFLDGNLPGELRVQLDNRGVWKVKKVWADVKKISA